MVSDCALGLSVLPGFPKQIRDKPKLNMRALQHGPFCSPTPVACSLRPPKSSLWGIALVSRRGGGDWTQTPKQVSITYVSERLSEKSKLQIEPVEVYLTHSLEYKNHHIVQVVWGGKLAPAVETSNQHNFK